MKLYHYETTKNDIKTIIDVYLCQDEGYKLVVQQGGDNTKFKHVNLVEIEPTNRSAYEIGFRPGMWVDDGKVSTTFKYTRWDTFYFNRENDGRYCDWFTLEDLTPLTQPQKISDELSEFLGLEKGYKISRYDVNKAVCAYIHHSEKDDFGECIRHWGVILNNNVRDLLMSAGVIKPDKALINLLHYDEYVKAIQNGEITVKRRDSETGKMKDVTVTDTTLNYAVLQYLLARHYVK